jgi:hypothetical protein
MWESLIAVGGTLAGGLVASVAQLRGARAERRENRGEARRGEALSAVTRLVEALADHRRAMWEHEDARLTGKSEQVVAALLAALHITRSAINGPMTTVAILTPGLAAAAREAAQATYAMRESGSLDVLEARRAVALGASDRLVAAAAEFFAGVGLVVA